MSIVVLCDFDATVVDIDTAEFILEKYSKENWRIFDQQLERGEITLEECMHKQFSTLNVPKQMILDEIEPAITVKPNFEKLVEYCRSHRIPIILVSAGLDFVINNFLERRRWRGLVKVYAPRATCGSKGIKFAFPKLFDQTSVSFKDDLVKHYKKKGKKVIYIGDGFADYHAARNADFSFAIKGSKLAELFKNDQISHTEIDDFQTVLEAVKAWTSWE